MREDRLDRQLRIEGWNQRALDEAKIGVVGDDDLFASLYVMSAAALGLSNMVVIAPGLNETLREIAQNVNPALRMIFIEGFYTHPAMDDIFAGCKVIVDVGRYGLGTKLLLEKGFKQNIPIIRGFSYEQDDEEGLKIFAYLKGREWRELHEIVSANNLPADHFDDGVLDLIASGIVLEETKDIVMGHRVSDDLIAYKRRKLAGRGHNPKICVVGAGAIGNFVGLGLAYAGFRHITFVDPDVVEVTNLNRQVFLADAIGLSKAKTLCERLNNLFGVDARAEVTYFRRDSDISRYDGVFDCVDNFETKIVLSEKCKEEKKVLISGGTSVDAGQVVVYDPTRGRGAPAEVLGLYEIVDRRQIETYQRERASCAYQPNPSVVMTNQIIAGFMVDSYRMLLEGQEATNIFYQSGSYKRI